MKSGPAAVVKPCCKMNCATVFLGICFVLYLLSYSSTNVNLLRYYVCA